MAGMLVLVVEVDHSPTVSMEERSLLPGQTPRLPSVAAEP